MDIRQLRRESTLCLPVQVDEALFSCGDAHGAQGDGKLCGTAVECPMFASSLFTLEKRRSIPAPQYRAPAPLVPRVDSDPFYGTTGVGGNPYVAAQYAVRAMIDRISGTYSLSREDAYVLCSVAVDLKLSEIVDGVTTSSARCSPRRSSAAESPQHREPRNLNRIGATRWAPL